MSQYVIATRSDKVLSLALNVPQRRNALSYGLLEGMSVALRDYTENATGVVISGAGGNFSSGADFNDLTGTRHDIEFDNLLERVVAQIQSSPIPIVAAVEGACIGAGAHLALACDVRFVSQESFIQIPAIRLGLLYSPKAIEWLSQTYPRDTVRRLLLLGERFTARAAVDAGLFSQVVTDGDVLERAQHLIAQNSLDHLLALSATRELLNAIEEDRYDEELWQLKRVEFLDSAARDQAVTKAKSRFT